jgi:hypothetical protein
MVTGNLGNIFLIIIPALCKEKGSPFGAPDVCQTYGLAYSSLSLAVRPITLFFSTLSTSGKPDRVCLLRQTIKHIAIVFVQFFADRCRLSLDGRV